MLLQHCCSDLSELKLLWIVSSKRLTVMVMKTRTIGQITIELEYFKTPFIMGLSYWILMCTVLSFVRLLPDIGFLLLKE